MGTKVSIHTHVKEYFVDDQQHTRKKTLSYVKSHTHQHSFSVDPLIYDQMQDGSRQSTIESGKETY